MPVQTTYSLSAFYGTNLQPRIKSYDRLIDRVVWTLGYPMINIELHKNQLYEFITIASEMFSKYAGYTEEYLIFNSSLYEQGKGIRLDKLFSITPELASSYTTTDLNISLNNPKTLTTAVTAGVSAIVTTLEIDDEDDDPVEFVVKMVDKSSKHSRVSKLLVTSQFLSTGEGIVTFQEYGAIFTSTNDIMDTVVALSGLSGEKVNIITKPNSTGTVTVVKNDFVDVTSQGLSAQQNTLGGYDTLIENYRKVVDVYNFEEGTTTGVNTLFTVEQTLAQQTYFSYSMGNYGFDLVSWYTVREWLDVREKMLTQRRSYRFNPRTQYLTLTPEPLSAAYSFAGVIACYVEKPLLDIIKEPWVYQYVLALAKVGIGRVRGKYEGTSLMGGGTLNANILQEGIDEKKELETQLFEGVPGFGDADPPMFFVG